MNYFKELILNDSDVVVVSSKGFNQRPLSDLSDCHSLIFEWFATSSDLKHSFFGLCHPNDNKNKKNNCWETLTCSTLQIKISSSSRNKVNTYLEETWNCSDYGMNLSPLYPFNSRSMIAKKPSFCFSRFWFGSKIWESVLLLSFFADYPPIDAGWFTIRRPKEKYYQSSSAVSFLTLLYIFYQFKRCTVPITTVDAA